MLMPLSCSCFAFVLPEMNQSNSSATPARRNQNAWVCRVVEQGCSVRNDLRIQHSCQNGVSEGGARGGREDRGSTQSRRLLSAGLQQGSGHAWAIHISSLHFMSTKGSTVAACQARHGTAQASVSLWTSLKVSQGETSSCSYALLHMEQ